MKGGQSSIVLSKKRKDDSGLDSDESGGLCGPAHSRGWIKVSLVRRSRPRNSEQGVTPVVAWGVVRYVNRKFTSWCCELYAGKAEEKSEQGLVFDVVYRLIFSFTRQGYQLFVDNFYTLQVFIFLRSYRRLG